MSAGLRFSVGDIVSLQWDTGAMGYTTLYGVVEQAGPKTFVVRWESGRHNRRPQSCHLVSLCDPSKLEAHVLLGLSLDQKKRIAEAADRTFTAEDKAAFEKLYEATKAQEAP